MGSSTLPVGARRLVAAGIVVVLVLVLLLRHAGHHGAPTLQVAPVEPAAARATPARGGVLVDVVGAVRRPGVYRLAQGSRVRDAVARAGGLTPHADPLAVNLAAPVADGEQVVVAARGAAGAGVAAGSPGAPVSLSSATAEQLDALPGIGPVTAQKIVAYRQEHGAFHSVDELDAIPGIGPSHLQNLKGLVVP